uniref:Uncharacterized protein n=1 Tax=Strigamia maritima TaxID=126957 RepID=T1JIT8_STRMM
MDFATFSNSANDDSFSESRAITSHNRLLSIISIGLKQKPACKSSKMDNSELPRNKPMLPPRSATKEVPGYA